MEGIVFCYPNDHNPIFPIAIKSLKDHSDDPERITRLLSMLSSSYNMLGISDESKSMFDQVVADQFEVSDEDMLRVLVDIVKSTKMSALEGKVVELLDRKDVSAELKIDALLCLKALDCEKYEVLREKFKGELIASKNKWVLEIYAREFEDQEMAGQLNEQRIERGLASTIDRDRLQAALELRELTGQDFGYNPVGSEAERAAAIEKWRAWRAERKVKAPVDTEESTVSDRARTKPGQDTDPIMSEEECDAAIDLFLEQIKQDSAKAKESVKEPQAEGDAQ
jgi:hypothetical protein